MIFMLLKWFLGKKMVFLFLHRLSSKQILISDCLKPDWIKAVFSLRILIRNTPWNFLSNQKLPWYFCLTLLFLFLSTFYSTPQLFSSPPFFCSCNCSFCVSVNVCSSNSFCLDVSPHFSPLQPFSRLLIVQCLLFPECRYQWGNKSTC